MRADLAVYVSGHGYGHATRTRAWLTALRAREPSRLRIRVRGEAPPAVLSAGRLGLGCSRADIDPGVVQPNSLDVDLPASLAVHRALVARWDEAVEREAAWIAGSGARLLVGDVPPLAFAAAERAGVPSLAVANFGWDWILASYAASDPAWEPVVGCYRRAYAGAALLLRLPLAGGLPGFRRVQEVPLLVNLSRRERPACRAALGVAPGESRPLVLVSFGGLGGLGVRSAAEDLSDYVFVCCDGPPPRRDGRWLRVETSDELPHEDVIHACDAVIGKPGYGTAAEALAHGVRALCLPRPGFPEAAPLFAELSRLGSARSMPRPDFEAGRWRAHLEALFAGPAPQPWPLTGGAEAVAEAVLGRL